MGFSLLTEALLREKLPEGPSKDLLVKSGYCIGFLIVILGRQQLFTENTLTPVLPVLRSKRLSRYGHLLRLWGVVFASNMLGAFIFALFFSGLPIVTQDTVAAGLDVSAYVATGSFSENFFSAIIVGWLVALLVWLMPFAEAGRIWIIILLTYVIGLGEFPHIVAGSVKAFVVLLEGQASLQTLLMTAFIPVLLGNTLGGVAFVALLNHGQVVHNGEED